MLTDHSLLSGKMPSAWHEEVWRRNPSQDLDQAEYELVPKSRLVVDETDNVLGTVSNRHTLVQNRDLLSALDVAAEHLGLQVTPLSSSYRRGKGVYEFHLPELDMQPLGDQSKTTPRVTLKNDHTGTGGLRVLSGWYRLICANGMTIGTVSHRNTVRHTGEIDVWGFVRDALTAVRDEFDVQRLLAENLSHARHQFYGVDDDRETNVERVREGQPSLVDLIMADTAERYDAYLRKAMRENQHGIGNNLWALTQAVSQTSTHRMPGANADAWATRQLNRIRQFADV